MFNLSVVYMMYQPDHWCKVCMFFSLVFDFQIQIPFFNKESFSAELGYTNYTWDQVLNSTIAYPKTFNKQRNELHHDQCNYFDRDYVHIKLSPWSQVKDMNATDKTMRCKEWEYDTSVRMNKIFRNTESFYRSWTEQLWQNGIGFVITIGAELTFTWVTRWVIW